MKAFLGTALLLAMLPFMNAAADHGGEPCLPCHEDAYDHQIDKYYIVQEADGTIYVYEETNGKEGLQRCDPHHHDINCECPPDTLVLVIPPIPVPPMTQA